MAQGGALKKLSRRVRIALIPECPTVGGSGPTAGGDERRSESVQIKISVRHGHLNDATQQFIRDKAEKLLHFFERLTMIEVTVDLQKDQKWVEFLVQAEHKHDFVARESIPICWRRSIWPWTSCQLQLRRYKEKIQDHRRTPSTGEVAGAPDGRRTQRRVTEELACECPTSWCATPSSRNCPPPTRKASSARWSRACGPAGQFRGADLEDIIRAILKRELLGSTGIGRGVAIPHTKHNSVERLIGTVALSQQGHRLRQPRRRAGPRVRPAHLAAGPARRPPARPGERLPFPARRQFRPISAGRHDAGRNHRPARQGRPLKKGIGNSGIGNRGKRRRNLFPIPSFSDGMP